MPHDLVPYFENDGELFESSGRPNGGVYWHAREFMVMMGYESFASFEAAINRAIGTCATLNISVSENFQQERSDDGPDYKLSRFACYLVAMNGDVKKPQVAAAQAYFATLAQAAQEYIRSVQDVERVLIRDDISDREKGLMSAAKKSGVDNFAFFHNAGYRGMYNMDLNQLKRFKKMQGKGTLLDFMGKRELAGNLFRLTETEARLGTGETRGQRPAEEIAHAVGQKVRGMMIENTGTRPEMLPLEGDIKQVRKGLKKAAREFKRLDKPKPAKKPKAAKPADDEDVDDT